MKTITPADVRPGMNLRITVEQTIPDGSALKSATRVYESVVVEAWVDGDEPIITLANPGFNPDFLEDGKPMRVALYADSKNVEKVTIEQLDYAPDTIVRAIVLQPEDDAANEGVDPLDPREFEPFMFYRSTWGAWVAIGNDSPKRTVRHGSIIESDIESGQQRFDIVEIVYAPQAKA